MEDLKSFLNSKEYEYEILCVNDCSKDESGKVLESMDGITVIHHEINRGYGASLKTGIKNAKYDTIVIMDADGQHNPKEIPMLLESYEDKRSMVIGKRKVYQTKKRRILGKILLHKIINFIFKDDIPDINSGFRVFDKDTAKRFFFQCSDRFSFTTSITIAYLANGYKLIYIPIEVRKRAAGNSGVSFKVGFRVLLKILELGMVYKPLRVILPLSMIFAFFGLISLGYNIYRFNITDTTVFLFSNSVILFVFALLAEQINNIRMQMFDHD